MTHNDAQIDVLMRRYARNADSNAPADHLDADELNAFAEGRLPAAARSSYVSHLADCDDCRKLATDLAITAGAAAKVTTAQKTDAASWRQKLGAFFAPPVLRYAAFAAVLVGAVSISFLAVRNRNNSELRSTTAPNEQLAGRTDADAVKPADRSSLQENSGAQAYDTPKTFGQPDKDSKVDQKKGDTTVVDSFSETEAAKAAPAPPGPEPAAKKAAEPVGLYSSQPPAISERAEAKSHEQKRDVGGILGSGPRKNEPDSRAKLAGARADETPREVQALDDRNRAVQQNQIAVQNQVRKGGPNRQQNDLGINAPQSAARDAGRAGNEKRPPARSTDAADAAPKDADKEEKEPETRSAGGRKFQRQGNAWVDSKFKPSMAITNISRRSDEFRDLDSGLRSIAEQLSGEIVVVWKGKAYRIR